MAEANDRNPVEALAEEFVARYRRGERPLPQEYAERHPALADQIRDLFPALVLMEEVASSGPTAVDPRLPNGPAPPLDRLGDYRVVREIGHGGMGVVYEAEHEALGRRVALKLLPERLAGDPVRLERFRREAKAAARLHHTNIVPVFDVGECAGRHYYAMQYIDGRSLDRVLGDRPPGDRDYYRAVARIGAEVADALAHAHGQGVLHRDVKPANLLLDGTGAAWLTDFGLAKEEGSDLTATGDLVGTLRYMAPERFNGVSGVAGDVYGLGVTLYEMLTRTPAFDGGDRATLIHRVMHQEPARPSQLDPRVPRDLETIVLKAMAKEAAARYAGAAELADDLRRFLADRPILARRASLVEQGWRWCRRNPAVAGLTAALGTLLLAVAVGATVAAVHFGALAEAERTASERAVDSEARLTRSYRLVESGQSFHRQGRWREAHADLTEAVGLRPDNPLVWAMRGQLRAGLGVWDLAADDLDEAFRLHLSNEASLWHEHAMLRLYVGDTAGYRQACGQMLDRFSSHMGTHVEWWVASACVAAPNDIDPRRAVRMAEAAHRADPRRIAYLITLGAAHYRAGEYQLAADRLHEACRDDGTWTNSEAWPLLAMAYSRLGKGVEARYWLDRTRWGLDQQTMRYYHHLFNPLPPVVNHFAWLDHFLFYREALSVLGVPPEADHALPHLLRCRFHVLMGRPDEAEAALVGALDRKPGDGHLWLARGIYLGHLGRWEEGAAAMTRAFALRDVETQWEWCLHALLRLRAGDPAGYRRVCAQMIQRFGWSYPAHLAEPVARHCLLGPGSATVVKEATRIAEASVTADPKNPWFQLTLGAARCRGDRCNEAVGHLLKALGATDESFRKGGTGVAFLYLSLAHHRLSHPREAREWLDRATALPEAAAWHLVAEGQILRREAEAALGVPPPAGSSPSYLRPWQEAIDTLDRLLAAGDDRRHRVNLGRGYLELGKPAKAAAEFARALEVETTEADLHGIAFRLAWLRLELGDVPGYRRLCAALQIRFKDTKDPNTAYVVARLCGLAADGADPADLVALAERAVAATPDLGWCQHTLGLAHYRAGQYEQAVRRAHESMARQPDWPGRVANWLVLALAHHRLGHADEARRWLDRATAWMDQHTLATPGDATLYLALYPHDEMACRLLRREAEALLGGRAATR